MILHRGQTRVLALFLSVMAGFCLTPHLSRAAVTSFWFSGRVSEVNDPFNLMPVAVEAGTPFSGRVTWDDSLVSWSVSNAFPQGLTATYYFDPTPGYTMEVRLGGHMIKTSKTAQPLSGLVSITDGYNDVDSLLFESSSSEHQLDGAPFVGSNQFSVMNVFLNDQSKTVHTNAAIPTFVPDSSMYPDRREWAWGVYVDDGKPTMKFSIWGEIEVLAAEELYILNHVRLDANRIQLDWSVEAEGYVLERTDVVGGIWTPVGEKPSVSEGRRMVVLPMSVGQQFFRLRR